MVKERDSKSQKKKKAKLPKGEQERLLNGEDALKRWDAAFVHEERRRIARDRKNLMRSVPSTTWFDDKWERDVAFPPGGDRTLMSCCHGCGRCTPPNCISSSGHCYDCMLGAIPEHVKHTLPGSTSSISLRRLNSARARGEQYSGGF